MTYTIKYPYVTAAIAAQTVTGLTIKDIDAIPTSAKALGPVLFPMPDFVEGADFTRQTLGTAGAQMMNMEYEISYVFCFCEIGGGVGGVYSVYPGLSAMLANIMLMFALLDNPRDGVELTIGKPSKAGAVNDLAGNQYWGCIIPVKILDFLEVP